MLAQAWTHMWPTGNVSVKTRSVADKNEEKKASKWTSLIWLRSVFVEVSGSEKWGFVYVSAATIAWPGRSSYWHILVPVWAGVIVGKSQTGFINFCHHSSGLSKLSCCFWSAGIRISPDFSFGSHVRRRPAQLQPIRSRFGSWWPRQIDNWSSEDVHVPHSKSVSKGNRCA